jgi:hypothetical protein
MNMKLFKRFIYLGYYLKQLDRKKWSKFVNYTSQKTGKRKVTLRLDAVRSVFTYNISLLDYFLFGFGFKNPIERKKWAGTGFMYEYQKIMNPKESRNLLENKLRFNEYFKAFIKRDYASLHEMLNNHDLAEKMLQNNSGKIVLKNAMGQVGAQVEVANSKDYSVNSLIEYMKQKNYDLIETFVTQHADLMSLSPSGLNTVRIFTQLYNGNVEYLGARLRISVNSAVDNMGAGNLAAPINMDTGIVNGPAVYSDITNEVKEVHPVTGKRIVGFQIPYWQEIKRLVTEAALKTPENRSIGWDVAVGQNGPELIEGNHNWCKILWQLPVKEGLKDKLYRYL